MKFSMPGADNPRLISYFANSSNSKKLIQVKLILQKEHVNPKKTKGLYRLFFSPDHF
jgi:hypothetical protein